jgi:hypothetical protein
VILQSARLEVITPLGGLGIRIALTYAIKENAPWLLFNASHPKFHLVYLDNQDKVI